MQRSLLGTFDLFLHPGYTNDEMAQLEVWTAAHGALMALAWVVLLPVGVIFARHRDVLCGDKLSGMAAFIAAWIIAFAELPWEDEVSVPSAGALGKAHKGLGIATFVLAVIQRQYWNAFHWNFGRFTMLVAWAALFTGIGTNHHPKDQQSGLVAHAVALAAIIGCILIWDAVLTYRRAKKVSVSPSVSQSGGKSKEKLDGDVEMAAAPKIGDVSQ
eukprot:gene4387-14513_t